MLDQLRSQELGSIPSKLVEILKATGKGSTGLNFSWSYNQNRARWAEGHALERNPRGITESHKRLSSILSTNEGRDREKFWQIIFT